MARISIVNISNFWSTLYRPS